MLLCKLRLNGVVIYYIITTKCLGNIYYKQPKRVVVIVENVIAAMVTSVVEVKLIVTILVLLYILYV